MEWTNVVRKLSDLQPWERNPRQINEKQAERLKESFEDFGQVETIAIGPENEIYNGHQRLNVLMAQHGGDYEIECRQSDRALSEKEREKLTVFLHKGAAGEWNWDILANEFEMEDLLDWGFEEYELGTFPKDDEWADAFESLPDGDRAHFQQMTFTLHDTQVEQVKEALTISKAQGEFVDSENENSNGNALSRIMEIFITDYGQS